MQVLRRTEKFETDKPSNRNLKRKPRGTAELETGGRKLRSACDTKQRSGERKLQEAEYRNRKDGMRDQAGRKRKEAPEEPPSGDAGKKGKERAES